MGEGTDRRIAEIESRSTAVRRWALGLTGSLVTAAIVWLFTQSVAHGQNIASISTKIDFVVETLKEVRRDLREHHK